MSKNSNSKIVSHHFLEENVEFDLINVADKCNLESVRQLADGSSVVQVIDSREFLLKSNSDDFKIANLLASGVNLDEVHTRLTPFEAEKIVLSEIDKFYPKNE